MNKVKIMIGFLFVLFLVSIGINFSLYQYQKNKDCESCTTESKSQTLSLIENEYTKNLNQLPEGWKTYKNEEYGFEINYPEEFEGEKIKIKDIKFKNREDLAATGEDQKFSTASMGSFKTVKEIVSFNWATDRRIDGNTTETIDSLFTIGIHPNESNLSFKEFVSQEILSYYKGKEILKSQKIVNLGGIYGYEFVYRPSGITENTTYYFPSKDNRFIFSINMSTGFREKIETSGVVSADDIIFAFSKANSQFVLEELEKTFIEQGQEEFFKKYPEYKLFEKDFYVKYLELENTKKHILEQTISSFGF